MSLNLQVAAQPLTGISRILKQTAALEESGVFSAIDVVGHSCEGQPDRVAVSASRTLVRVPALKTDKRNLGIWGKALWFLVWGGRVVWRYKRADLACVNAHSVSVLPLCWLLSVTNRCSLVYDTHELETETSTLSGGRKRVAKLVERLFVHRCDLVLVVTTGIGAWYERAYPGVRPVVVRNVPEAQDVGADPPDLRATLGVPDESLLFIHTGNLVAARNIALMLDAFGDEEVEHHLLFLGSGGYRPDVVASAQEHRNIHLLPPVSHDEVVRWVSGADVGLCLIETTSQSYQLALPNKLFETLLAGVGLISTYLGEAHHLLGGRLPRSVPGDAAAELARSSAVESTRDHDAVQHSVSPAVDPDLAVRGGAHDRGVPDSDRASRENRHISFGTGT